MLWSNADINKLHSDFINEKTVQEMADSLNRTEFAIINKLFREDLIDRSLFNELFNELYFDEDKGSEVEDEDEDEDDLDFEDDEYDDYELSNDCEGDDELPNLTLINPCEIMDNDENEEPEELVILNRIMSYPPYIRPVISYIYFFYYLFIDYFTRPKRM
jgi:hypothetical protein